MDIDNPRNRPQGQQWQNKRGARRHGSNIVGVPTHHLHSAIFDPARHYTTGDPRHVYEANGAPLDDYDLAAVKQRAQQAVHYLRRSNPINDYVPGKSRTEMSNYQPHPDSLRPVLM